MSRKTTTIYACDRCTATVRTIDVGTLTLNSWRWDLCPDCASFIRSAVIDHRERILRDREDDR